MARPTKYRPEMKNEVLSMMQEGASIQEVSAALGICRASLYNWKRQYPEFLDTIKRGESCSQAWWERQGRQNLKNRNFNNHHWFRQMCNRFGWRNYIRRHNSEQHRFALIHKKPMTEKEWIARYSGHNGGPSL
ncbi:transposase [Sneathiella sp.]|uniref:transposase n=1 Tax=Sneathiella sp. TaxID=1964365 RepID=UPI002626482C|nr:transposase [Sneathiella sp.]MDF2366329.1 transposase [Sneathiella sp.]